ncbi:MAG: hypothetical protein Q9227_000510 [Pyrenula ochraceoflavens]
MLCKICHLIFKDEDSLASSPLRPFEDETLESTVEQYPHADGSGLPRLERGDHHLDIESLRNAIGQKCSICFPLWQEFSIREKLDFLDDTSKHVSTCYNLMDGAHEEAIVLSPGPIEYLLEIQVYVRDRHIDSKIYILTPLEEDQLFWECRELDACETYPDGMPYQFLERANAGIKLGLGLTYDHHSQDSLTPADYLWKTYGIWADIVTAYRRCNLTKSEDKLVAFSGIAKEVQSMLGNTSNYLAGLWSGNLLSELLWAVGSCQKADGSPSSRPQDYRAPSWSWAAVDGAGTGAASSFGYPIARLLEAQVTPVSRDYTGQIIAGYIRLQGCLIKVRPYEIHSKTGAVRVKTVSTDGSESDFLVSPDVRVHNLDLSLHCLPIYGEFTHGRFDLRGLVLQHSASESRQTQYSRFGTFFGFGKTRWAASKLPPNVSDLVQGFRSTLERDSRTVLEGHYDNDELKRAFSDKFGRVEESLVESLHANYDSGSADDSYIHDDNLSSKLHRRVVTLV